MSNETIERLQARVSVLEDQDRQQGDAMAKLAESSLALFKELAARVDRIDGHDRLLEIVKDLQKLAELMSGQR